MLFDSGCLILITVHIVHCLLYLSNIFKHFSHHFFIIKMIFHSFYLLVFFMSLSCYQDNIFRLCQADRCFYCFFPVSNRNIFSFCCRTQSCFHILNDLLRIFTSWIIRSEYHFVAMLTGHFAMIGLFVLSLSPPHPTTL